MFSLTASRARIAFDMQKSFLAEILSPSEGGTSEDAALIFADWLEERGDPMAQWLRDVVEDEEVIPVSINVSETIATPFGEYGEVEYDEAYVDGWEEKWDRDKLKDYFSRLEPSSSPVQPGATWYQNREELWGGDGYDPYSNEDAVEQTETYRVNHPQDKNKQLGEFYGKILYALAGLPVA